jgi:hypothetical protein
MILALSVLVMTLTTALNVAMKTSKYMITALLYTTMRKTPLVLVVYAVIMMIGGMIQQELIIASVN